MVCREWEDMPGLRQKAGELVLYHIPGMDDIQRKPSPYRVRLFILALFSSKNQFIDAAVCANNAASKAPS
ncbi:hypothetical protein J21TS7_21590 [Paenibacillus cineris]|uniref:Uncharacterized protein n=1 Tax=Paenibacillus cineris TaxID=237530 RepID=A0ABQ4LBQ9_9BACL|nr:hypothetical protein J21TS7_21590 [Paenibacillus cineris]